MAEVRYTVAQGPLGLTPISRAQRGERYLCLACAGRLIPRRGQVLAHHYAHASGHARCDADQALRRAARDLIIGGFGEAGANGGPYYIEERCLGCDNTETVNIAHSRARAEPGGELVPDLHADVTIQHPEAGPLAVFVVTADAPLSDLAWRRGEASGTPCAIVEVNWGDVGDLEVRLAPTRTANMDRVFCSACYSPAATDDSGLRRLEERRPTDPAEIPFAPWDEDRFGRPLFWSVRAVTHAGAVVLVELGFRQAAAKPWLFWYEVEPGRVVFADYGSTRDRPIWEDTAALLYWRFGRCSRVEEAALVRGVLRRCRAAGAPVRLHPRREGLDGPRRPDADPDPRAAVDEDLLQRLLEAPVAASN